MNLGDPKVSIELSDQYSRWATTAEVQLLSLFFELLMYYILLYGVSYNNKMTAGDHAIMTSHMRRQQAEAGSQQVSEHELSTHKLIVFAYGHIYIFIMKVRLIVRRMLITAK